MKTDFFSDDETIDTSMNAGDTSCSQESDDCCRADKACQKERAEKELLALKEQLIYAKADIANIHKRFERERQQLIIQVKERLLHDILTLADDLDRLAADVQHPAVGMMVKNMDSFLQKQGLVIIQTQGAFDPSLHEAIAQVPAADEQLSGTIAQTLQKGYLLNGQVIRPARVSVYA